MAPTPQWTFLDHLGACVGEKKEFCEDFNQVVCKSWIPVTTPGWWGPLGGSAPPFFLPYPPPPP